MFSTIASSCLNYPNFSTSCPFLQFSKVITQSITTEYKIEHFNHVVEMLAYIYPFLTSNLTQVTTQHPYGKLFVNKA